MTESGAGLNDQPTTSIRSDLNSSAPSALSVVLSLLTLAGCGIALLQIDLPLLRFLRALNLSSMQTLGDLGEKIGNGGTLIAVSLIMVGIGWLMGRPIFLRTGVESLLAHACVALLVNGLKHLIGRPRPRLTHSGEWMWWPSWDSGLDSLPSGHSSASFAVATVFAKHFPWTAWPVFGLAAWVAMSRVWRGSHFVTDVVAGMTTGYLVGTVFTHSLGDWKRSLLRGIANVTPAVVIVTATFWIMLHRVVDESSHEILIAVGILLIALGMIARWARFYGWQWSTWNMSCRETTLVIGLGLSCATGSFVVIGVTILAVMARWMDDRGSPAASLGSIGQGSVLMECLYTLGVVLLLVTAVQLTGIIPIL